MYVLLERCHRRSSTQTTKHGSDCRLTYVSQATQPRQAGGNHPIRRHHLMMQQRGNTRQLELYIVPYDSKAFLCSKSFKNFHQHLIFCDTSAQF